MPAARTLQEKDEAPQPWYETSPEQYDDIPASTMQETSLCSCTLRIKVPPQEAARLRELYSPLLQWIDPMFQIVRVEDEKNLGTSAREKGARRVHFNGFQHPGSTKWREPSTGLLTQALSIILFLRNDCQSQLTAKTASSYLKFPLWELHHKIELTSRLDLRVVARQIFYASSPSHELPLWSVCPIHCGREQLRFNIFVNDFNGMRQFYSTLLNKGVSAIKPGFCVFEVYSQPGLEIQLALKYSPCLFPERTMCAMLSFRVKNISQLRQVLPYKVIKHEAGSWITRDVDGNTVLLSRDTSPYSHRTPQVV